MDYYLHSADRRFTFWFFISSALLFFLLLLALNANRAYSQPELKTALSQRVYLRTEIDTSATLHVAFERINLGSNVNSKYGDLYPIVSPDESIMFFARKGDSTNTGFPQNHNDEDIWFSVKEADGSWGKAAKLSGPLNTTNYDGVRAMNSSGTHLYLQNIYRDDGTRAKGFSMSRKLQDGSWSFPDALEIEDYYNDTTTASMTISTDESIILFSLKRKDSKGGHDLYLSRSLGGLKWSKPEPIAELNTPGDEISPFVAFDDHTLYFSTNGRGGYGSYDIFISRRLDDTWMHWSPPRNMGEPINTPSFDAYLMVSARGDTAYFSSSHESSSRGFGKSDIWKMGLKTYQRPGFNLPTGFAGVPSERDLYGSLFRLDNVLFDVGRASIKEMSQVILDTVAATLQKFPSVTIEVQGHTDADGSPEQNMRLSQDRASSVRDYLMSRGVAPTRIRAKGYGMTRPIAPNTTPAGKALNRRVMILVDEEHTGAYNAPSSQ